MSFLDIYGKAEQDVLMSKPVRSPDSPSGADIVYDSDEENDYETITTPIDSTKCCSSPFVSASSPFSATDSTPVSPSDATISVPSSLETSPVGTPISFHTKQYIRGSIGHKFASSVLNKLNFTQTNDPSLDNWALWTQKNGDKIDFEQLKNMKIWQRFGRFPGAEHLTRRDMLWTSVYDMVVKHGDKFNFVPQTYVLPKQYKELRRECKKSVQENKKSGPWMARSLTDGVTSETVSIVSDRQLSKLGSLKMSMKRKKSVVSKCIENPLLIDGYKFDLRFYVLVTSFDPLRVYFFNDGIARFCSERFDATSDTINPLAHISGTPTEHNFRTVSAVLEILKSNGVDSDKLMQRIHDITIKALISVQTAISEQTEKFIPYRRNCYQLYGIDISVDNKLKPWLIDVASNPSLEPYCQMEGPMKGKLIADMLRTLGLLNEQVPKSMKVPTDLSEEQTNDVIATLTESRNSGGFELIYPARNYFRYDKYMTNPPTAANRVIVENKYKLQTAYSAPPSLTSTPSSFFRMYPTPVPVVPSPVVKTASAPAPTLKSSSSFFRMYPI